MRPQAPAYLRIPYTNYPALACYWVRRPQYVRENIIQGWYRGTYTSVLGTYRTYTTRLGTVLRYVPSAQIDLGTVPNTAYRTGYTSVPLSTKKKFTVEYTVVLVLLTVRTEGIFFSPHLLPIIIPWQSPGVTVKSK